MPKFTTMELEVVEDLLLKKGKALFAEYGLKKTSIDEIVQACGIAKGSFYRFYSSKEELYFAILKKEEVGYLTIYESMLNSEEDGAELISKLIKDLWTFLRQNPFLISFYERREQEQLFKKIARDEIQHYTLEQRKKYIDVIEKLQLNGKMTNIIPDIVEGMIRGVLIVSLHPRTIGNHLYEDVMNQLIQSIGVGLEKRT